MADQVEISLPKTIYLEEDTFPITAYFRVRATKAASTPTTVHYRVDDLRQRKELVDWTSVTTGANVTITMTAVINEIQDDSSHFERKQITVQADRGLTTQVHGKAVWRVRNVEGIV